MTTDSIKNHIVYLLFINFREEQGPIYDDEYLMLIEKIWRYWNKTAMVQKFINIGG